MNVVPNLLVNFVVLVMFVHSSDIVQGVFVDDLPQLFVFDVEQTEQELRCLDGEEDVFGPQDHDGTDALLPDVGVEVGSVVFEDVDDLDGEEGEFGGEVVDVFGEEDEEFGEPLVFFLDVGEELVELLPVHEGVLVDLVCVERGVGGDFHVEFFELFEEGVVDFFDLPFLHC